MPASVLPLVRDAVIAAMALKVASKVKMAI